MRRLLCVLCLLGFLSGCAEGDVSTPPPDGSIPLYFLTDWYTNDQTETLLEALYLVPDEEDAVAFCLQQLFIAPLDDEGLRSPFPPGARALSHTLRNGLLTVVFSEEFAELTGVSLTLAEACLTLTLCALPDVTEVEFASTGATWPQVGQTRFSAADFPLEDLVLKSEDQILTLYFVDPDTMTLAAEEHRVILPETKTAERYVLEALLGGPKTSELRSALPGDTQLINISTESEICSVNFSATFFDARPPYTHALAIRAITLSLTDLPDVRAVQLYKEGQIVESYGDVKIDEPLM